MLSFESASSPKSMNVHFFSHFVEWLPCLQCMWDEVDRGRFGRTWVCAVVRGLLASSIFVKKDPSLLARWGVENRLPRANGFFCGTLLCCDSLGHPSSLFFLGRVLFSFSCTSRCWIDLHPSIRWKRGRSSGSIGDGYSDDPGSRTRWVSLSNPCHPF